MADFNRELFFSAVSQSVDSFSVPGSFLVSQKKIVSVFAARMKNAAH